VLSPDARRNDIREWLRLSPPPHDVAVVIESVILVDAFERRRIVYTAADGDRIPAFLLVPTTASQPRAAILIHHQHHGERHLGKSEVCGLAGDPLQAFGVALAQRGFVVLAPDSICFEDRRAGHTGINADPSDWQQHYNEMTHRLVRGDTLMRKVLDDAATGLSVLLESGLVDSTKLGVLGHSYGGNTVLFQAALDDRVRFGCSSGAACSYRHKLARGIGIEMAEVLPGVAGRFDIDDLLTLTAPRPMLVLSATDDPYSEDASDVVRRAQPAYAAVGTPGALEHTEFLGEHALTAERFDRIIDWLTATAGLAIPASGSSGVGKVSSIRGKSDAPAG
jgi:dienelactone hydrolase